MIVVPNPSSTVNDNQPSTIQVLLSNETFDGSSNRRVTSCDLRDLILNGCEFRLRCRRRCRLLNH